MAGAADLMQLVMAVLLSSVTGYALMAVAVLGRTSEALPALLAFMTVYGLGNLCAFAVVTELRGRTALSDYRGLIRSQPVAVTVLALAFLSLVGIPPLAGFLGKFSLFAATLQTELAWLALVAVANTVLSLVYYLRVLGPAIFGRDDAPAQTLGGSARAVLWASAIALLSVTLFWTRLWTSLPISTLP